VWAAAGLLRALRPDAVALVDSFGLSDYLLNSALGKYDGDVYNDLLRRAKVGGPKRFLAMTSCLQDVAGFVLMVKNGSCCSKRGSW
jgi:hypothetical protein